MQESSGNGLRLFTLYVGSAQPPNKAAAIKIVGDLFESFTLQEVEGCFRGQTEPTLLIKLATNHCTKVIQTAGRIRDSLHQDGVGIEYKGRYYRCTEKDPASALSAAVAAEG